MYSAVISGNKAVRRIYKYIYRLHIVEYSLMRAISLIKHHAVNLMIPAHEKNSPYLAMVRLHTTSSKLVLGILSDGGLSSRCGIKCSFRINFIT